MLSAIALPACSRHREKLGQSLKSIILNEPSAATTQSPPYIVIPNTLAASSLHFFNSSTLNSYPTGSPLICSSPNLLCLSGEQRSQSKKPT